ncbi:cupin domain-containing protein [Streptosporangium sp. KLBMP 9127]|nr:cupin domain-containing protein [Streptosporangium sp. KLBMP 9127]
MTVINHLTYVPFPEDPHNYKPNSRYSLVLDPARRDGAYVKDLVLNFELLAPGEVIPVHEHTNEEVLIIDEGTAEAFYDGEWQPVGPGSVIMVPPGVAHGFRNVSGNGVRLHAVFAGHVVGTRLLERSPAPGTEDEPLPPPSLLDFRGPVYGEGNSG